MQEWEHRRLDSPPSTLQLLLWSNLLMAGSAAGWVVVSSRALGLPLDPLLVALAFVLAVAFYTRDRLDRQEWQSDLATMPERTAWVQRHAQSLEQMVRAAFAVALLLLLLRPAALPPILAGLGFALTYTVRWIPWQGRRVSWKQLPGMKMPYVALLWALLTVLVPAGVHGHLFHPTTWSLFLAATSLIMMQILLNDLRDREGDEQSGTLSWAVLHGVGGARLLGVALAALATLVSLGLAIAPLPLSLTALYSLALLYLYRREEDGRWRPWIELQGLVAGGLALL